jgi:hypothetical protein
MKINFNVIPDSDAQREVVPVRIAAVQSPVSRSSKYSFVNENDCHYHA